MRSFQSFQGTFSTRLRHMEYKTLALLLTWWPKKRLRLQKWNPNPQGGTNILPTFGKTLKSSSKLTFMGRYDIYIYTLVPWRINNTLYCWSLVAMIWARIFSQWPPWPPPQLQLQGDHSSQTFQTQSCLGHSLDEPQEDWPNIQKSI